MLLAEEPATTMKFVYHSSTQMNSVLKATEERCAEIARTYSIGRSIEGRDLLVIEFSDNPGKHELCKPSLKGLSWNLWGCRSFMAPLTLCSGAGGQVHRQHAWKRSPGPPAARLPGSVPVLGVPARRRARPGPHQHHPHPHPALHEPWWLRGGCFPSPG